MDRLVRFQNAETVETPLGLLAELRTIDPTIELVYVGDRWWWLGAVRENSERRKAGEFILSMEQKRDKPNPKNVMLGRLLVQGFARIQAYQVFGDVAGPVFDAEGHETTILEDLRERDFHYRKDQGEAVFEERMDQSEKGPERRELEAKRRTWLTNDIRAEFRRVTRNRTTFLPSQRSA